MEYIEAIYHFVANNVFSLLTLIISLFAYQQSRSANSIAKEANIIAKDSIMHSQDKDKRGVMDGIIETVKNNWSKDGGARVTILAQWQIHKDQGFTIEDFNAIWKIATLSVKHRPPKQSFQEILEEESNQQNV